MKEEGGPVGSSCAVRGRTVVLRAGLVLVLALVPRLVLLDGHDLTADEPNWIHRGVRYLRRIGRKDFEHSTEHFKQHPGITGGALVGAGCMVRRRLARDDWGFLDIWSEDGNNLAIRDYAFAARLPVALAGALTCLLLYLLGRKIWPDRAALWAAAFLSVSPFHVALSRVAHLDSLLTLFAMLTRFAFYIS